MGHFTINLPDGRQGDVRFGTVKRMRIGFGFFFKNRNISESKTGYVVKVNSDKQEQEQFWLFKSKDGRWTQDIEGKKELNTELYRYLRNAITEKEARPDGGS